MLRGSLCPDGAVMKIPRPTRLLEHEGRASCSRTSTICGALDDPDLDSDADERDGAPERRAGRRAPDAGVGSPADPGEAPAAGVAGPGPHLRRADERHLVRRRRPARRAGVGGRRPARSRPRRRPIRLDVDSGASTSSSTRRSSPRAARAGSRRRARTSVASAGCTDHVLQANRAATSTSSVEGAVVADAVTYL